MGKISCKEVESATYMIKLFDLVRLVPCVENSIIFIAYV